LADIVKLIAAARGTIAADMVLTNAQIVNTFSGDIERGNVAVIGDRIAGIGDYSKAKEVIDLDGKYLAPALINGHIHVESSMLHPARYAEAVVPRGVSAVVTDLHEIANVKGLTGIKYMLDSVKGLPLDMYFMVPSCVPATHLETSGAQLAAKDVASALSWDRTVGLGEVMNFPAVLNADREVLAKLAGAKGKVMDGHAPGLKGMDLNAYIASGMRSDHECTLLAEAREKLGRGMRIMIREGSSEKNLEELLPLVTDNTYKRCMFVVDDRSCADLLRDGDIDAVVRKAIKLGLDPVRAIQLSTINTAEYFGLRQVGAVAPGYLANLVVISDLPNFTADMVFHRGKLVAQEGRPKFSVSLRRDKAVTDTMKVKPFGIEALRITTGLADHPVIGVVPDQIITKRLDVKPKVEDGLVVSDTERDILKLVVVERHKATGNIGLGMVKGTGLKRGALASSIAHDSHNIVAVGVDDADIFVSVKEVERMGGGLVIADGGKVIGSLPLPVAGMLSDEPLNTVVERVESLDDIAANLGTHLTAPFATLSFLALPVIPELRLTDRGLVDVMQFKILD